MDRFYRRSDEHRQAMRAGGTVTARLVLRACGRERGESRADAAAGRAVHTDTLLRRDQDDRLVVEAGPYSQSETREATIAADGIGSDFREATIVGSGTGPSHLSLPVARIIDPETGRCLGDRHHVYPASARVHLSGSDHGLVQPLRAVLGSFAEHGGELLCPGFGLGVEESDTGHLQFRPGAAVYEPGVHEPFDRPAHRDQHGRPRPSSGQRVRRTFVAHAQVRRDLPEGLRRRRRSDRRHSRIFSVLQLRALASSFGLSNTSWGLLPVEEGSRQRGHIGSRLSPEASFIGDPGATFFGKQPRIFTKKAKEAKRKKGSEGKGLWKLPQPCKSGKVAFGNIFLIDFHRCLKKPAQKTLRLFHSYAQARRRLIYQPIQRQRSTLRSTFFCLKNGEYLKPRITG